MSEEAKAEWIEMTKDGKRPKLKEIRELVKKHKLLVKTNTGGPERRTTVDVIIDVNNALGVESNVTKKEKPVAKPVAKPVHPDEESALPLPVPKKDAPSSSSANDAVMEEDEVETNPAATVTELLALAKKGDGKKVIEWVNEFNLSGKLSKSTLESIVQDCSRAGKK